jgi:hypothetical protein
MATKKITMLSPFPKEIQKMIECDLLHSKIPTWDGDYVYSPIAKKEIKNIRWVCKEGCK